MSAHTTRQPTVPRRSVRNSDHQGSRGRRSVRAVSACSCGAKWRASGLLSRATAVPSCSQGMTIAVLLCGVCQLRT